MLSHFGEDMGETRVLFREYRNQLPVLCGCVAPGVLCVRSVRSITSCRLGVNTGRSLLAQCSTDGQIEVRWVERSELFFIV